MTTLTIKIPEKKITLVKQLLKELGVTIQETRESDYSPEFVAKVKKSHAEKDGKTVSSENLWQSIK